MVSTVVGGRSARATQAALAAHVKDAYPGATVLAPDVDGILSETENGDPVAAAVAVGIMVAFVFYWLCFAGGIYLSEEIERAGRPLWQSALTAGLSGALGFMGWNLYPLARDAFLRDEDSQASFVDLARGMFVFAGGGMEYVSMNAGVVRSMTLPAPSVLNASLSRAKDGRVDAIVTRVDGTVLSVRKIRDENRTFAAFEAFAERCAVFRKRQAA